MAGFRIPELGIPDEKLGSVTPAAHSPNISPNSFGASVGQALLAVGQQVEQVQERQRAVADTERVMVEMGGIHSWIQEKVDSPETGVLSTRELNAKGITESTLRQFRELGDRTRLGLANEQQRLAFQKLFQTQYISLERELSVHEGKQLEVAGAKGYEATLNLSVSSAARAAAFGDVEALKESQKLLADVVGARAMGQGWGAEQTKAELLKERTKLHEGVLTQLGKDEIPAARLYLKTVRGEPGKPETVQMDGVQAAKWDAQLDEWESQLSNERVTNMAAALAETLYQKHKGNSGAVEAELNKSFEESGGTNGRLVSETRRQYNSTLNARKNMRDLGIATRYDNLYGQVLEKYNRDIELAKKDPAFNRAYNSLPGPERDRMLLELGRVDKDVPEHLTEWGNFIGEVSNTGPGWSDRVSVEQFAAKWRGRVGEKRWPDLLNAYKSDKMRDRAQDSRTVDILADFESNLRVALKFKRGIATPDNAYWENATPEQRRLGMWAKAQMMRVIQEHHDEMKKKGPGTTDPLWYYEPMGQILQQVSTKSAKTAASKGIAPPTPSFNQPARSNEQVRALAERIWRQNNPGVSEVNKEEVDALVRDFQGAE